jgi:hypothetical protein
MLSGTNLVTLATIARKGPINRYDLRTEVISRGFYVKERSWYTILERFTEDAFVKWDGDLVEIMTLGQRALNDSLAEHARILEACRR